MDYYCDVCDKIIKTKSESKHLESLPPTYSVSLFITILRKDISKFPWW